MHLEFYNLEKEPFHITPNPEFLFSSPSHREALAAIIYGVEHRSGFISIISEVGLGKTTLIRSFLEQANKQEFKTIYILNPDVSFGGLLKSIYRELGIVPKTDDLTEMVHDLHLVLIDEYNRGHTVVLIIDEAQNLPIETLENLRMLSNLETDEDKLIQLVLVGQPEFEEKLNLKELRQLNQRIVLRARITPLSTKESIAYIQHRLSKAGHEDIALFSKSALRHIIRQARGVPRILNILCGNALVTGFAYQEKQISARTAKEVIADFQGKKKMEPLMLLLYSLLIALIIVAIFMIYQNEDRLFSKAREIFASRNTEPLITQGDNAVPTEPVKAYQVKIEADQPAEKETSKPESNTSSSEKSTFPVKRVVEKGDTLYSLIEEVYGSIDGELIAQVKKQNKRLAKNDKIQTGEILIFPEPPNGKSLAGNE